MYSDPLNIFYQFQTTTPSVFASKKNRTPIFLPSFNVESNFRPPPIFLTHFRPPFLHQKILTPIFLPFFKCIQIPSFFNNFRSPLPSFFASKKIRPQIFLPFLNVTKHKFIPLNLDSNQ